MCPGVMKRELMRLTLAHKELTRDTQKVGRGLRTQFLHQRYHRDGLPLLHLLDNAHKDFMHGRGQIDPGSIWTDERGRTFMEQSSIELGCLFDLLLITRCDLDCLGSRNHKSSYMLLIIATNATMKIM